MAQSHAAFDFHEVGRLPAPDDNVAIATQRLDAGTIITYEGQQFTLDYTVLEAGNGDDESLTELRSPRSFEPLLVNLQVPSGGEHQVDVTKGCDQVQHVRHVPDERSIDVETARLNELSSQLVGAQSQTYDTASREKQSHNALAEVEQNSLIQGLKHDLAASESDAHI